MNYILDENNNPVLEPDLLKWADWFETSGDKRTVEFTKIGDNIAVSTVFLSIDHSFGGPVPILYETLCFQSRDSQDIIELDGFTNRYATREEALIGHHEIVATMRKITEK
jgi:hypothetical protein